MEEIRAAETNFRLIRLRQYEEDLKKLTRLEPRLHPSVLASLKTEIESGKLDEVKGTGGWVKGRAASPSRNIGKSGGFRFIYLLLRVESDIYLFTIYDHRKKSDLDQDEIKQLKAMSEIIKKSYRTRGDHESKKQKGF
jgi:hypothetical protein